MGAPGVVVGEGGFTTAMTGYEETVADPRYLVRRAALVARVPCVTTISAAAAAVHAIAEARAVSAPSLRERIGIEA